MKAQSVEVREAAGRTLCSAISHPTGRRLFGNGHVLSVDDVIKLKAEGLSHVWVTELEEGELGENDAVERIAAAMGSGSIEIRMAAGGRANVFATEDCCVLVDNDLLLRINMTQSMAIATTVNFTFARAGQRVATIKSAPFAVSGAEMEALSDLLLRRGPILQARPIRHATIAVLYTDPVDGARARQLFESVMGKRLENYGAAAGFALAVPEEEATVARALQNLVRARPTIILVASTTAPAGPGDVIGRALARIECQLERFLAPVEPGNLPHAQLQGRYPHRLRARLFQVPGSPTWWI